MLRKRERYEQFYKQAGKAMPETGSRGLRLGGMIGGACVRSCWPLMLACAFTGHTAIAMAGGMAVGALERWSFRPRVRAMFGVTVALASYYGLLALLEYAPHGVPAP